MTDLQTDIEQVAFLVFKQGTSDKVYNVFLEKRYKPRPNSVDSYVVYVTYGRRNGTLRRDDKMPVGHTLSHAQSVFENLVNTKKKLGYTESQEQTNKEIPMATATKRTAKLTTPDGEERKMHKISSVKVKTGDLMALIHYVKVKDKAYGSDKLTVSGLDEGVDSFDVIGRDLIDQMYSADQFAEEVKVTKTKAAELLVSSYNRPLTVSFAKVDGSERVLRGRLVQPEPLLGRSMVEDLDVTGTGDARLRQVDHRTINYLIVDGVKYVVK